MDLALTAARRNSREKDWHYYRIKRTPTRDTMGISGMPLVNTPTGEENYGEGHPN